MNLFLYENPFCMSGKTGVAFLKLSTLSKKKKKERISIIKIMRPHPQLIKNLKTNENEAEKKQNHIQITRIEKRPK